MAQPRAKADEEGAQTPQAPAVAHQTVEGDEQAKAGAQGAVTRRYRATRGIGSTRWGEEFDATDDDPRVLSGYVEALDDDVPDEVQAALES